MSSFAYYNGKFGKKEDICIPLSDRSIFFADAVYEAAIGSFDRILWEGEHIDRFLGNAKRLGINHRYKKRQLSALLREVGVKSMLDSYLIYFQLSRDLSDRCHSAVRCGANLLITVDQICIESNPPPMKLITLPDMRHDYCDIKTTNLLPAVISATIAEKSGCDEAVFIREGIVTECTKSNISILNQGRLITPPISSKVLPGITRAHILLACEALGIQYEEKEFTEKELFSAEEILITSTTKLCKTVSHINSVAVGGKDPITAKSLSDFLLCEYEKRCKIPI